MREREFFSEPSDLGTKSLVLVEGGLEADTVGLFAGSLDPRRRRGGRFVAASAIDLGAKVGVVVEELAADASEGGDAGERDRLTATVKLAERSPGAFGGRGRAGGCGCPQDR